MATLLTSTELSGQVVNDHFCGAEAEQSTAVSPFSPWLRQAPVTRLTKILAERDGPGPPAATCGTTV
ncbi:hypothetical protein LUR56_37545 [Streptomyces sp. MT29]|nr:hypothetical protein [Streptomyces sp. MT29]